MNQVPEYIAKMSTNEQGQMILNQRSLFSFFHRGMPFMIQLTRNYYKGLNMGDNQGYNVRMMCYVGKMPLSIQGGPEHRNTVLNLIYRSNYHPNIKFYVNSHHMIVGVTKTPIKEPEALCVKSLLTCCIEDYNQIFPFIDMFNKYIPPPGKVYHRYAVN